MKDNLVETLVGFGVIVVAAIFVFYGYSVTDSSGGDGYVVSAEFDRVDGLTIARRAHVRHQNRHSYRFVARCAIICRKCFDDYRRRYRLAG